MGISDIEGDIVYHYCGINAFINIIQHSTIWLSDVFKSNDSKEFLWARENVKEEILQLLGEDKQTITAFKKGLRAYPTIANSVKLSMVMKNDRENSI